MKYLTDAQLPYYYALADTFAVGDRYFASVLGPSYPNHSFFLYGTSCGSVENMQRCELLNPRPPSITDLLESNSLTHESYEMQYPIPQDPKSDAQRFLGALKNGELANVSFITCDPTCDEHPGIYDANASLTQGQYVMAEIINAAIESPHWESADIAIFLVYDEHGGYYDHVPPPEATPPDNIAPVLGGEGASCPGDNFNSYGFRVPAVVISPWVKRHYLQIAGHYVSHVTYDHTSLLKFIETNWSLPSLTGRDKAAQDMFDFFDFNTLDQSNPKLPLPQVCDCEEPPNCSLPSIIGRPGKSL